MIQHRQSFEQPTGKSRKKSFRAAKVCWAVLLSAGLFFTQLTPVFARNGFHHPVVPGYAPPRVAPPHPAPPVMPPPVVFPPAVPPPPAPPFSVFPPAVRHHPPIGRVFRNLPPGYAPVMLADSLFYYHAGAFYSNAPGGFVVVDAPVGAVIPALPADYSFFVVDGVRYYTSAGVYYLPVRDGYLVVADPRGAAPQPVVGNKVMVTSYDLNVRSGPGGQYYIASRAHYGDILLVLQRERDWLYVQLPDNNRGWVMTKFTAPAGQRADG